MNIPISQPSTTMRSMSVAGTRIVAPDYGMAKYDYALSISNNIGEMGRQAGETIIKAGKLISKIGKTINAAQSAASAASAMKDMGFAAGEFGNDSKINQSNILQEIDSAYSSGKLQDNSDDAINDFLKPIQDKYDAFEMQALNKPMMSRVMAENPNFAQQINHERALARESFFNAQRIKLKNAVAQNRQADALQGFNIAVSNDDPQSAANYANMFVAAGGDYGAAKRMTIGAHNTFLQNAGKRALQVAGTDGQAFKNDMAEWAQAYSTAIGDFQLLGDEQRQQVQDFISGNKGMEMFEDFVAGKTLVARANTTVATGGNAQSISKTGKYKEQKLPAGVAWTGMRQETSDEYYNRAIDNAIAEIDKQGTLNSATIQANKIAQLQQIDQAEQLEIARVRQHARKNNVPADVLAKREQAVRDAAEEDRKNLDFYEKQNQAIDDEEKQKAKLDVLAQGEKMKRELQARKREIVEEIVANADDPNAIQDVFSKITNFKIDKSNKQTSKEFVVWPPETGREDTSSKTLLAIINNLTNFTKANDPAGEKLMNALSCARLFCNASDYEKCVKMLKTGARLDSASAAQLENMRSALNSYYQVAWEAIDNNYPWQDEFMFRGDYTKEKIESHGKKYAKNQVSRQIIDLYNANEQLLNVLKTNPSAGMQVINELGPKLRERQTMYFQTKLIQEYIRKTTTFPLRKEPTKQTNKKGQTFADAVMSAAINPKKIREEVE